MDRGYVVKIAVMDLADITSIVSGGESETMEFKKSTSTLDAAAKTLCAFLNADGGTVAVGVNDKGEVLGQEVSDKTRLEIAGVLRKFEPPPYIDVEYVPLSDPARKVILLRAASAKEVRPFTFDGRPYHRIETATSVMPQEAYQRLLFERARDSHRWELATVPGIGVDALDQEEILRTARVGVEAGRLPEAARTDPTDILERLGLMKDGELLNAAVVLYGTRFLPEYPQCQLRMAVFKGTDKTEFIDNRQINGHAFELLGEAMTFLRRHLPVAGRVQPGLFERVDEPLFPPVALREALVNALCHRDYSRPGGSVSLAIYDDRLEIWNDGTLPPDLSVEDLKRDHQSFPRNPLIAEVFFKRNLVERWGRGTQKIVELCVEAGHPEPEFVEHAGSMGVRFLPSGYIAPHRVALELTLRQREICHILAGEELPLRTIIARLTNPPAEGTVRADLQRLKHLEVIGSKGRGRGAVWFLGQTNE